ncbi:MAG: tRNA (adenosine(37)-N6)-dimethylallyltransferase MiaA [Candidatus Omnitrophota bacterium]
MKKKAAIPIHPKPGIIFLVGPTAIGKSRAAVHLARELGAEIVSMDSMQVYKGMDIISAKPTASMKKEAKHHLLGMIAPSRSFNASDYRRAAVRCLKGIIKRKKIPLFVGGCGLYMSAVLDGIFTEKTKDRAIRNRLEQEAVRLGKEALYQRLKEADPAAALKIHPNDLRRVIRALEVYEKCGIPISQLQKERKGIAADHEVRVFGLNMDRACLYGRINKRVEAMFRDGLVKEATRLLRSRLSRTASAAIGIREIKEYLKGSSGLEEAKALIMRNSRLYAKRQMTWFRKDKRVEWLMIKDKETAQHISARIRKVL